MTGKQLRPYLKNIFELEGKLQSSLDIIGLRSTESLNMEFNVEINYAWMQVWTTPETIYNDITSLFRGDYVHMRCRLRTESTKHTESMDKIILECDEIYFTGTLKEMMEYKGIKE